MDWGRVVVTTVTNSVDTLVATTDVNVALVATVVVAVTLLVLMNKVSKTVSVIDSVVMSFGNCASFSSFVHNTK